MPHGHSMLTVVTRFMCRDQPLVDGVAAERDHGVAAHRRIALIVHEQHGEIGAGKVRLDQQRAVHVVVAARLEDQQRLQMIEVGRAPRRASPGSCRRGSPDSRR